MSRQAGRFLALDGFGGVGKSTTLTALADLLRGSGHQVHTTTEPSTSALGHGGASCTAPALPGQVVNVDATDMGHWYPMGAMSLTDDPNMVHAGTVSLRVVNTGSLTHEVVVLPLPAGQQPGQRPMGTDGRIDEAGSLGEASHTCGAGEGDGIAPGAVGWTTLTLQPGRYELVCNIPGHYASGMYTELDVTGQ